MVKAFTTIITKDIVGTSVGFSD